ncbi:MAG: hypothetical protein U0K19_04055 [Bifidobacteriaceae bacterium]|nr:hypothetical protein [Bifidobacteriaceae bacterium]
MIDEWDDATVNDNNENQVAAGGSPDSTGFDNADLLFDDANSLDRIDSDVDTPVLNGMKSTTNAGSGTVKDAETAETTEEGAIDANLNVSGGASAMDEFSGALAAASEFDADGAEDVASRHRPFVKGLLILAAVGLVVLLIGFVARSVWKLLLLSGGCLVLVCGLIGAICVALLGHTSRRSESGTSERD